MKLALAFAAVVALMPGMSNQDPTPPAPPQPTITIDSPTPHAGDTVKVTYTGKLPVTLNLDWDPAGTPTTLTIPVGGTATLVVPAGTSSLIVTDPTPNGANAAVMVVQP